MNQRLRAPMRWPGGKRNRDERLVNLFRTLRDPGQYDALLGRVGAEYAEGLGLLATEAFRRRDAGGVP